MENFTDYNSDDEEQEGLANEETERKKLIPLFSPRFGDIKLPGVQKNVTKNSLHQEVEITKPASISNITLKGKV